MIQEKPKKKRYRGGRPCAALQPQLFDIRNGKGIQARKVQIDACLPPNDVAILCAARKKWNIVPVHPSAATKESNPTGKLLVTRAIY